MAAADDAHWRDMTGSGVFSHRSGAYDTLLRRAVVGMTIDLGAVPETVGTLLLFFHILRGFRILQQAQLAMQRSARGGGRCLCTRPLCNHVYSDARHGGAA